MGDSRFCDWNDWELRFNWFNNSIFAIGDCSQDCVSPSPVSPPVSCLCHCVQDPASHPSQTIFPAMAEPAHPSQNLLQPSLMLIEEMKRLWCLETPRNKLKTLSDSMHAACMHADYTHCVIEANGEMTKYRERAVIERGKKRMVSFHPGSSSSWKSVFRLSNVLPEIQITWYTLDIYICAIYLQ